MPIHMMRKAVDEVIVTTTPMIPGVQVDAIIEIITAEVAFGMNVFKDIFAKVKDVTGGRSKATQNILRDARKQAIFELKKEALKVGADAVVSVDLDYSEFSGGGKSMLFIIASGTAVKLSST
ncbi:MAG TPA: YbjQ family protein [Ignavibacteria bacterium]|nr:YbjQ family protein [Ignavibacteria bacterium]